LKRISKSVNKTPKNSQKDYRKEMAVSALNMTPYFGGYPFQGKHRQIDTRSQRPLPITTITGTKRQIQTQKSAGSSFGAALSPAVFKRGIITRSAA